MNYKDYLKISRADIRCDKIVDYGPDQFLKVPISKYFDLLGLEPIASQIALINAVNNPKYRFVCAALSRRQGKTYVANIIGQCVTLIPGCSVLIISPDYSLSQISFDLQRNLIRKFDLEVTKNNLKERILELGNGSTIRMGSITKVDSCVGRSYDLIIFDEAALSADGEDAFNIALRPTLDKLGSKAIFISTPRGKTNWFSRFWERGFSSDYPDWISIQAPWQANPRAIPEDIEQARRSMSEAEFKQEYEADFNQFEGQIWNFEVSDDNVKDLSDLDISKMEILGGLDVGARDPTAFVVIAYDWDTEMYYVLAEYQKAIQDISKHAEKLAELIEKYGISYIYIDSAALQTRIDLASMYDIPTMTAKKSVVDGIAAVSTVIDHKRLIVDKKCTKLLSSLDSYRWDPNPNLIKEKPVHDEHVHLADALRYAIYSFNTASRTV